MYERVESEYFTAKRKAAKRLCRGNVKPSDLPSNAEIRELIQVFARLLEGEQRSANLCEMRLHALWLMRILCRFRPRLIGSVMTGHGECPRQVQADQNECLRDTDLRTLPPDGPHDG